MALTPHRFTFIGQGALKELRPRLDEINPWGEQIGKWRRFHGDEGVASNVAHPNHPANYRARADLADAVNTAIALSKPLLLTGNPGTGKSQLAERIAWEFNLGPVLRFEAQSLSEAQDLFYRFDLVGHLSAVEMLKAAKRHDSQGDLAEHLRKEDALVPQRFVKLGPLGEAIVRSQPAKYEVLFNAVFGPAESAETTVPRPSVVLIDEIDKASRDFPNDLLNGIERLEFRVRELGLDTMYVDPDHRPIVIITSNSERDLPAPFLRRCTFFHIGDPTREELTRIVAQRFFSAPPVTSNGESSGESDGEDDGGPGGQGGPGGPGASNASPDHAPSLPPLYQQLLEAFWNFREERQDELQYRPGTSELIDWTAALRGSRGVQEQAALLTQIDLVRKASSSVSKHKDDQRLLLAFLSGLKAHPA